MQSFLQYRRLGNALETQLACDKALHQQQQEARDGKAFYKVTTTDERDLEAGLSADTCHTTTSSSQYSTDDQTVTKIVTEKDVDYNELCVSPTETIVPEKDIERGSISKDVNCNELCVSPTESTGSTPCPSMTTMQASEQTRVESGPELENIILVSWESDEDPFNPQNWGFVRRVMYTFIVSAIAGVVGCASAIDSAVIPQASAEFGVTDMIEALATSMILIGFGLGGLIAGPFSETVGRNPIYLISMVSYMLFLVGAGASPNIQSQVVCRFFAGIFGATPLVCAGGSVSDLWTPAERVFAFPMFACFAFLGPMVGPVIGDWVGQSPDLSWRWTEWFTLIISAVVLAMVLLILPETYSPVLLRWKAEHLRRLTGDDRFRGAIDTQQTPLITRLHCALYRPFVMLVREPIPLLFGLYLMVDFIILFTFFTGYTYIFTDIYGLSQGMTGVCFIGEMIGVVSCAAFIPLNMYLRKRDIARAKAIGPDEKVAPESRLYWAMIGGPAIPISLFWMGWTASPDISIWSSIVASAVFGFGMLCVFMTTYQYLIDTYEIYAASALAAVTFLRYTVSGAFVEISIPFYQNMGVAYTLTILGGVSCPLVLIPFAFYWYGPAIRRKSRY